MLFSYVPFGVTVMVLGCPDYLHVWPYVLSGIQSEVPNDSPDIYDIISVFGSRENSQSGTPFERLGHLESLTN